MMKSFTHNYLETHTYEEVENEGKRLGLWKEATPCEGIYRSLISYSKALSFFRSGIIGDFRMICN